MIRAIALFAFMLLCSSPAHAFFGLLGKYHQTYKASKNKIIRHPYLQMPSESSMVLRWRSKYPGITLIEYGENIDDLDKKSYDLLLKTEHEVKLEGLRPNTKYFYAIYEYRKRKKVLLEGKDFNHFFITAPSQEENYMPNRVWVLGDAGSMGKREWYNFNRSTQKTVRDAFYNFAQCGPMIESDFYVLNCSDLILTLGDNAYSKGTDNQYQKGFFNVYQDTLINTPSMMAFGNHDAGRITRLNGYIAHGGLKAEGSYFDQFTLPANAELGGVASKTEAYYSFNYGHAHFIVLDSYDAIWEGIEELNRSQEKLLKPFKATNVSQEDFVNDLNHLETIEDEPEFEDGIEVENSMLEWLKEDLKANTKKWTIVAFHHPPYSSRLNEKGKPEAESRWLRRRVVPVLDEYKVDLVLSGHTHKYERTHQMINGQTSSTGIKHSESETSYQKGQGPIYIVSGSAGQSSHYNGEEYHEEVDSFLTVSMGEAGSLILEISPNSILSGFLNKHGEFLDQVQIAE